MFADLELRNTYNHRFEAVPITFGMPVPQGVATAVSQIALLDAAGEVHPVQVDTMATWRDGSIRWALLDFVGDVDRNEASTWRVALNEGVDQPAPANPVRVLEREDSIEVSNHRLTLTVRRDAEFNLVHRLIADGAEIIADGDRCDVIGVSAAGKIHRASNDPQPRVSVEQAGSIHTIIRWDGGLFAGDGARMSEYRLKLHVFADNPYLKIEHAAVNRELPERGVFFRSYRIELQTRLGRRTTTVVRQKHHGRDWTSRLVEISQNVRIIVPTEGQADSFTGPANPVGKLGGVGKPLIEDASALDEATGELPHFLKPDAPRVRLGGGYGVLFPFMGVRDEQRALVASILRMAPQHPKALSVDENRLTFELYPDSATPWRLARGMTKVHHLALSCFGEPLSNEAIDHEAARREHFAVRSPRDPVQVTLHTAYARQTGEIEQAQILPHVPDRYPRLESKIAAIRLHGDPLAYSGMMDWGEKDATNNEEDQGYEYAMEYFRTGRYDDYLRHVQQMLHNTTVDVVDWDPDPLRMGGTPYHTSYHQDAVCVTSHTWTEGMFVYAYMTGDRDAYRAAINVCEWILRFLDERPHLVKQDGREIGWPIIALVAGYRATWDQRYLDGAYRLIAFYKEKIAEHGSLGNEEPPGTGYTFSGYGEYAGFEGMHKLWRLTRDEELREFAAGLIGDFIDRGHISFHGHGRMMDLYALYAVYDMTGDDKYLTTAKTAVSIALARPNWDGYFYRRVMHFLGLCHEKGLIDDRDVVLKS